MCFAEDPESIKKYQQEYQMETFLNNSTTWVT